MLRLLIDHQTFSMQQYGGISRYFSNIHHAINGRNDMESVVGILYSKNYYLKDYPAPLDNMLGRYLLRKQHKRYQWNMNYSKYLIDKNQFDVLHPSYYDPYFLKYNKKPFVVTVHDMIHEKFPEYFDPGDVYVRYKRICIDSADQIIAISESTSKDLQDILNVKPEKIKVIHHGYQMNDNIIDLEHRDTETSVNNFLLYVGDRKGYKNFPLFLSAVSSLLNKEKDIKLICAGGGPFAEAETEMIRRLQLQKQVSQISASDHELKYLYQNALAFIFPSLYEGFGLPILEAFNYNCPVIASDHSCFREIGENAIAYFDPRDMHNIVTTIEKVITSKSCRKELISQGQLQLLKFPMELCMKKTLSLYQGFSSDH